MKGVGAQYPKWDETTGKPINLELRSTPAATENMGAEAYEFDKPDQKPMTTFIQHQSLGMPVKIDLRRATCRRGGRRARKLYYTRIGQLNLSCANCHEDNKGKNIRADHLSQGQINGFPTYRLKTTAWSRSTIASAAASAIRAPHPQGVLGRIDGA